MLNGTQTLEGSIDHDGQSSAQSLTLLHAGKKNNNNPSLFLLLLFHVYEQCIIISWTSVAKSSECKCSHDFINS